MAKTASLNATSRPGARCPEGEPGPALPSGARAAASERTQRTTEAAHPLLVGDGITGASSMRVGARTRGGAAHGTGEGFAALCYIDATTEPPPASASHLMP